MLDSELRHAVSHNRVLRVRLVDGRCLEAAVSLFRAHVDDTRYAEQACRLEKIQRTFNVDAQGRQRHLRGSKHADHRRTMDGRIRRVFLQQLYQRLPFGHFAYAGGDILIRFSDVCETRRDLSVQTRDPVPAGRQRPRQCQADEPGRASYEHVRHVG
jgi:hypothetical protein